MLDRDLRRTFPRQVEAEAVDAAAEPPWRRPAPRPDRPADVHDRSRHREGLRRRDLGRARGRPRAHLGAHRRRQRVRAAGQRDRARDLPARDQRLRPRRGRADAARGAVERGVLAQAGRPRNAVTVELRDGRRRRRVGGLLPLRDPQRQAADLRRGRRDLRGRRERRGRRGASRSPPRARSRRALQERRERAARCGRVVRAAVRVRRRRPRRRRRTTRRRPSRTG